MQTQFSAMDLPNYISVLPRQQMPCLLIRYIRSLQQKRQSGNLSLLVTWWKLSLSSRTQLCINPHNLLLWEKRRAWVRTICCPVLHKIKSLPRSWSVTVQIKELRSLAGPCVDSPRCWIFPLVLVFSLRWETRLGLLACADMLLRARYSPTGPDLLVGAASLPGKSRPLAVSLAPAIAANPLRLRAPAEAPSLPRFQALRLPPSPCLEWLLSRRQDASAALLAAPPLQLAPSQPPAAQLHGRAREQGTREAPPAPSPGAGDAHPGRGRDSPASPPGGAPRRWRTDGQTGPSLTRGGIPRAAQI